MDIHYALNLEPVTHDLSIRTLERYIALFEHDELAKQILHELTIELVNFLGTRIDKQRLDSTHIFSDMASFGRTRLVGMAIKRFLTQVKRCDVDLTYLCGRSAWMLRAWHQHGMLSPSNFVVSSRSPQPAPGGKSPWGGSSTADRPR